MSMSSTDFAVQEEHGGGARWTKTLLELLAGPNERKT